MRRTQINASRKMIERDIAKLFVKSICCSYLLISIGMLIFDICVSPSTNLFDSIQNTLAGIPFILGLGSVLLIPAIWEIIKEIFFETATTNYFLKSFPGGPIALLVLFIVICYSTYQVLRFIRNNKISKVSFILLVVTEIIWFFIVALSFPILEIMA